VTNEFPDAVTVDALHASLLGRCLLRVGKDFERETGGEQANREDIRPTPRHERDTSLAKRGRNRESDESLEDGLGQVVREGGLGPEGRLELNLRVPIVVTSALRRCRRDPGKQAKTPSCCTTKLEVQNSLVFAEKYQRRDVQGEPGAS
jgi:hypothetical protein